MHEARPVGRTVAVALVMTAVLLLRARALAGPTEDYQLLFGEEDRQVAASSTRADDVAFAEKLLEAAEALEDSPELRVVVLEKACTFGARAPEGHAAALRAIEQLAAAAPERAGEWRDKRLEIRRAAYNAAKGAERDAAAGELLELLMAFAHEAGQEGQWAKAKDYYEQAASVAVAMRSPLAAKIRRKTRETVERQEAERRLEEMTARLSAQPENVSLRKIVIRQYLLGRDDPAEAARHLTADLDEATRTYVPLAARDPDSLPEALCLELAEWYASLVEGANAHENATALLRAHRYYTRYLALHEKQDAARLKAALARDKTQAALEEMGKAPAGAGGAGEVHFDDPELKEAFDKGVKYLLSRQADNGSFPPMLLSRTAYPVATTAAAVVILIESGAGPDEPAVARALTWLSEQETNSTLGLSLRARAYLAAGRTSPKYILPLARDVRKLLASTADGTFAAASTGTPRPLTGYALRYRGYDLISTALGLRGVAAGAQAGVEVPEGLWNAAMNAVLQAQHKDAGWGTSVRGQSYTARTAGGILAAALCLRKGSPRPLDPSELPAPVEAGLRRLGVLNAGVLSKVRPRYLYRAYNSQTSGNLYRHLWLVSEAARATGQNSLGGADWFKTGADLLRKLHTDTGAWQGYDDGDAPTIFALLFLINGARMPAP